MKEIIVRWCFIRVMGWISLGLCVMATSTKMGPSISWSRSKTKPEGTPLGRHIYFTTLDWLNANRHQNANNSESRVMSYPSSPTKTPNTHFSTIWQISGRCHWSRWWMRLAPMARDTRKLGPISITWTEVINIIWRPRQWMGIGRRLMGLSTMGRLCNACFLTLRATRGSPIVSVLTHIHTHFSLETQLQRSGY